MRLKDGVRLAGVQPEIVLAIMLVGTLYRDLGLELTVTSITDFVNGRAHNSFHPVGLAFDCRIWGLPTKQQQEAMVKRITEALGPEFDVVLKSDHIHVEFDVRDQ